MKANDLRIGNYVNVPIPEQCPFRIDAFEYLTYEFIKVAQEVKINGTKVHPLTWYGGDLTPIPLDGDFLVKMGFVKSKGKWGDDYYLVRSDYEIFFVVEHWIDVNQESKWHDHWHIKYTLKPHYIKYVHELQNLFYALTGEELKIIETDNN